MASLRFGTSVGAALATLARYAPRSRALAATLLFATCAEHHISGPATPNPPPPPIDQPARYQLTYYYVADERDFDGLARDTEIEDPLCTKIATVSADFF